MSLQKAQILNRRLDNNLGYQGYIENLNSEQDEMLFEKRPQPRFDRPMSAKAKDSQQKQRQRKTVRPISAKKQNAKHRGFGYDSNNSIVTRLKTKKVPMDKERLYEENLALKIRVNTLIDENKKLRTRVNQLEKDVNKREDLLDEIRTIGADKNIVSPPLRNMHIINNLKIQIKDLRQALKLKDDEIIGIKRTLKSTRYDEMQIEVQAYVDECTRLKHHLEEIIQAKEAGYTIQDTNEDIQEQQTILINNLKKENRELEYALKAQTQETKKWQEQAQIESDRKKKRPKKRNNDMHLKAELQKLKNQLKNSREEGRRKEANYQNDIKRLSEELQSKNEQIGKLQTNTQSKTLQTANYQASKEPILPVIQEKQALVRHEKQLNSNPPKIFKKIYRKLNGKSIEEFISQIGNLNQMMEASELHSKLKQVNINIKQSEFYQNVNQLYLATLEGIKLQSIADKFHEYSYANDSFTSTEEKQSLQVPQLRQRPESANVRGRGQENPQPRQQDNVQKQQVQECLDHISLRMQLHRIPKENLSKTIFPSEPNMERKVQKQEIIQLFTKSPFKLETQLENFASYLMVNGENTSVKQMLQHLTQSLSDWKVFTPEIEKKYDSYLSQIISKNKISLKEGCKLYDHRSKGIVTVDEFFEVMTDLQIALEPELQNYIRLLFYSHEFKLNTVPYRHFIKAYGSPPQQEEESSQVSSYSQQELDEEERASIVRHYLSQIAEKCIERHQTLRDVFQSNSKNLVYPDKFAEGIEKLGLRIEKEHILLILEGLQYEEEEEYVCIHIGELEEILEHYGVQVGKQSPIDKQEKYLDQKKEQSTGHIQKVSLLGSDFDEYEYSDDSPDKVKDSPQRINIANQLSDQSPQKNSPPSPIYPVYENKQEINSPSFINQSPKKSSSQRSIAENSDSYSSYSYPEDEISAEDSYGSNSSGSFHFQQNNFKMVTRIVSSSGKIRGNTAIVTLPLQLDHSTAGPSRGNNSALRCAMSFDGNILFTADKKGNLTCFNLSRNHYSVLQRGVNKVNAICYIPGQPGEVAVGLSDKSVGIYPLQGTGMRSLKYHKSQVFKIQYNFRKNLMLSISKDVCVIWKAENWTRLRQLYAETSHFVSAAFTVDGLSVITCFRDGNLIRWSLQNFSQEGAYFVESENLKDFALSSDGIWMYVIGHCGDIHVFQLIDQNGPAFILKAPQDIQNIEQVQYLQCNKLCYRTSDGWVHILNLENYKVDAQLQGKQVCFSAGGDSISTVSYEGISKVQSIHSVIQSCSQSTNRQNVMGIDDQFIYLQFQKIYLNQRIQEQQPQIQDLHYKENIPDQNKKRKDVFKNGVCQHDQFANQFKIAKMDPCQSSIQHCNLLKNLKRFGEYPDKYRVLIWRFLLQCPGNRDQFSAICQKGLHPAFSLLHQQYPVKSHTLYNRLERVLSALAYWSPIFGEVDYFPQLVFPFATQFKGDELNCFETIMIFTMNWLQHWFEFYPSPPVNYLVSVDNIIKHWNEPLWNHLQKIGLTPTLYVWPALKNLFTEVFDRVEWLRMMDHLITQWDKPELLIFTAATFFLHFKNTLMSLKNQQDYNQFIHKQNPVIMKKFMAKVNTIYRKTPETCRIVEFKRVIPVQQGQYQLFTGYPKFIIEYQDQVRSRIIREEQLRQNQEAYIDQLKKKITDLEQSEEQFRKQWQSLITAEQERQKDILYQESKKKSPGSLQQEEELLRQHWEQLVKVDKERQEALITAERERQQALFDAEKERQQDMMYDEQLKNKLETIEKEEQMYQKQWTNLISNEYDRQYAMKAAEKDRQNALRQAERERQQALAFEQKLRDKAENIEQQEEMFRQQWQQLVNQDNERQKSLHEMERQRQQLLNIADQERQKARSIEEALRQKVQTLQKEEEQFKRQQQALIEAEKQRQDALNQAEIERQKVIEYENNIRVEQKFRQQEEEAYRLQQQALQKAEQEKQQAMFLVEQERQRASNLESQLRQRLEEFKQDQMLYQKQQQALQQMDLERQKALQEMELQRQQNQEIQQTLSRELHQKQQLQNQYKVDLEKIKQEEEEKARRAYIELEKAQMKDQYKREKFQRDQEQRAAWEYNQNQIEEAKQLEIQDQAKTRGFDHFTQFPPYQHSTRDNYVIHEPDLGDIPQQPYNPWPRSESVGDYYTSPKKSSSPSADSPDYQAEEILEHHRRITRQIQNDYKMKSYNPNISSSGQESSYRSSYDSNCSSCEEEGYSSDCSCSADSDISKDTPLPVRNVEESSYSSSQSGDTNYSFSQSGSSRYYGGYSTEL